MKIFNLLNHKSLFFFIIVLILPFFNFTGSFSLDEKLPPKVKFVRVYGGDNERNPPDRKSVV